MPELPEVEVLVRALEPHVVGRRIARVRVRRARTVAAPSARGFTERLLGQRIHALRRRGKTLWAELDEGHWLIHLRMTGWLNHYDRPRPPGDPHVLVVVTLDRGELHFRDPRRFGRMWWLREPDRHFADLGPEPLERGFDAAGLRRRLARRRAPIKQALLDPAVVAGIGNIYASEACFRAGLDPRTPACALDAASARRLTCAVRAVLRRAIRLGSTVAPVVDGLGARALFPREFAVYGREGEPCPRCGTQVVRAVLGQRSTWWCPRCQPPAT